MANEVLRQDLRDLSDALESAVSEFARVEGGIDDQDNAIEQLEREVADLTEELDKAKERIAELEAELNGFL